LKKGPFFFKRHMKVGFTYDLKTDHRHKKGVPKDAYAELDREETIRSVEDAITSGGFRVKRIGHVRNLLKNAGDLDVDIVLNICEGLGSRNRESEVPLILDLFKIPFVGSDALTLGMTLDKVMAKKVFAADGVPTPKYFVADGRTQVFDFDSMKFPLIVKPRHEGSSKGISEKSIVTNKKALKNQVDQISRIYRQPALVEEFISGREFTVLVIGNEAPVALPSVQIQIAGLLELGDLVYTFRRLSGTDIAYVCPSKISDSLEKKLRRIAVAAYQAVECRDFGRVDFRVDKKGNPYVLEINPLPSFSVEDVFPLIAAASHMTYNELVVKIIRIGLERYGLISRQN
jgi:D-alanine-D-alanine ligase